MGAASPFELLAIRANFLSSFLLSHASTMCSVEYLCPDKLLYFQCLIFSLFSFLHVPRRRRVRGLLHPVPAVRPNQAALGAGSPAPPVRVRRHPRKPPFGGGGHRRALRARAAGRPREQGGLHRRQLFFRQQQQPHGHLHSQRQSGRRWGWVGYREVCVGRQERPPTTAQVHQGKSGGQA